ncbi:YtxH domain-containing protein [Agromyces sp. NPDC056523]|uniref:YtxH domain-containing protein n=1 Tax=Agromyces sp. NPDC056523 TaxID=3345850 RepID=UPI00366B0D0A
MKGKILFVVGLGVGYVLGTRAGRERYEQIRKAAQDVWNQPKVQEGVQTVKDFAMSRAGDVGESVLDGAKKFVAQVSGSQDSSTTRSTAARSASSTTTPSNSSAKPAATSTSGAKSGAKATARPKTGSGSSTSSTTSSS